jgi:hypothetical protein
MNTFACARRQVLEAFAKGKRAPPPADGREWPTSGGHP